MGASEIFYSPLALADLDAIYDIVGSDYPQRGYDFVKAIRERLRKYLLDNPELGLQDPNWEKAFVSIPSSRSGQSSPTASNKT